MTVVANQIVIRKVEKKKITLSSFCELLLFASNSSIFDFKLSISFKEDCNSESRVDNNSWDCCNWETNKTTNKLNY